MKKFKLQLGNLTIGTNDKEQTMSASNIFNPANNTEVVSDEDTRIRAQLSTLVKDHPYATIGSVIGLIVVAYRSGKSDAIEEILTSALSS